jgi:hypothetical protein
VNTLGPVPERSNARYTGYLTDETDTVIALAGISTLTLTVRDKLTNAVINSRSAQNVLNTNGVTVHATSGLVTWTLTALDTTPLNRNQPFASHIAEFACTWATTKSMVHPVEITIALAPY